MSTRGKVKKLFAELTKYLSILTKFGIELMAVWIIATEQVTTANPAKIAIATGIRYKTRCNYQVFIIIFKKIFAKMVVLWGKALD